MVLGVFLVQFLCSSGPGVRMFEEACWLYVHVCIYKAVGDFVEHPHVGQLN